GGVRRTLRRRSLQNGQEDLRPRLTSPGSLREGGTAAMTTFKEQPTAGSGKLKLAEILKLFTADDEGTPLRFTAYDGSSAGPEDAPLGLNLLTPRGTTYLATAPGDLGLARAYVSGDLEAYGVHPGDPYELLT